MRAWAGRLVVALVALMWGTHAGVADPWCQFHPGDCEAAVQIRIDRLAEQRAERIARQRRIIHRVIIPRRDERRQEVVRETRQARLEMIGVACLPPRRVIGEEHSNEETAKAAADRAWAIAVSYDHGRRYQDLTYARGITHTCSRSRPSKESAVGQAVDAAGIYYKVCVTEASPCRPSAQEDEKER